MTATSKYSVSVTEESHAKIFAAARDRGVHPSKLIEEALDRVGAMPIQHETQESIEQWRRETFGLLAPSMQSAQRLAARVNVEMAELITALAIGNKGGAVDECADVLIVLYGVAQMLGVDLLAMVDRKMAVNRRRRWTVDNGTGQHVRDREVSP